MKNEKFIILPQSVVSQRRQNDHRKLLPGITRPKKTEVEQEVHKGENAPQENENTPADRDSPQVHNGHITQGNTPQDDLTTDHEVALHLGLPPPEPLDLTSGNVSENWRTVKCHKRSYAANRHWQRYHECFFFHSCMGCRRWSQKDRQNLRGIWGTLWTTEKC